MSNSRIPTMFKRLGVGLGHTSGRREWLGRIRCGESVAERELDLRRGAGEQDGWGMRVEFQVRQAATITLCWVINTIRRPGLLHTLQRKTSSLDRV